MTKWKCFNFAGPFFDVTSFAHLQIQLNLNISLSHVTDVCQYIHSVSHAARTNKQQMNLAAKSQGQDRLCEEFLRRIQDQLLSVGRDCHQENGYTTFNVLRSPKYQHAVREKGDQELVLADDIPPPVISASPPPTSSGLSQQQPSTQRICSRPELKGDKPMEDLVRTCTSWYVPEVHPDSPSYNPDSAVAIPFFWCMEIPRFLGKPIRQCRTPSHHGGFVECDQPTMPFGSMISQVTTTPGISTAPREQSSSGRKDKLRPGFWLWLGWWSCPNGIPWSLHWGWFLWSFLNSGRQQGHPPPPGYSWPCDGGGEGHQVNADFPGIHEKIWKSGGPIW